MIALKKFLELPAGTRLRKLWRLAAAWEETVRGHAAGEAAPAAAPEAAFFAELLRHGHWPAVLADADRRRLAERCCAEAAAADRPTALVALNDLTHCLAAAVGREAAEWDLRPPPRSQNDGDAAAARPETPGAGPGRPGARVAYCDRIRSPFNAGSIIRSAEAFGFDAVVFSPECPPLDHPRLVRSAMGARDWIECLVLDFETALARYGALPFALELGGTPLAEFEFPERGMVVLGSEEVGVHPALLDACRRAGGVATIGLPGRKASLNVGVSFGVLAAAWRA